MRHRGGNWSSLEVDVNLQTIHDVEGEKKYAVMVKVT